MNSEQSDESVLVHLAAGVGNIVLATPLLVALDEMGFVVDLLLDADYPETADLLRDWSVVRTVTDGRARATERGDWRFIIPATPPFYAARFKRLYARRARVVSRPPDSLFYSNEQDYYLAFARSIGYPAANRPACRLPICPSGSFDVTAETVVLAPGCKTGEMAAKRWPYFTRLAAEFGDVAVVGTPSDLETPDGSELRFPAHVRSFAGKLTLRETAELLASAGAVVGNDSGLSHVAAAVGTPTVMIFGPTPHSTLGRLPSNVAVVRAGLDCEPCWYTSRFRHCSSRIDCLRELTVATVAAEVRRILGRSSEVA